MTDHRPILFVGSLGLDSVESAFRTLNETVGDLATRYPDGECGERSGWIIWQNDVLGFEPQLVVGRENTRTSGGQTRTWHEYAFAEGVDPATVEFGSLGYADEAKSSYEIFKRLRAAGEIPAGTRFQVSLPTPAAVVAVSFIPEAQVAAEPVYERAMLREIEAILAAIPHEDLAIQWDVCQEVLAADGGRPVCYDDPVGGTLTRLKRLGEAVPEGVELGYHFCYGDPGHKHIREPKDLALCVEFSNGVCAQVDRSINWIHVPVPRDRDDDAYFAPLKDLKLKPGCEFYLGLVHMTGGFEGTKRRLAAAEKVMDDFGIATECGFGRRAADTISPLLRLHAQVAQLGE